MATRYPIQALTDCHPPQCCCPACRGLVPQSRPLFGPGQTLTAADLNALEAYVQSKNRLHNRYLHGWGVVCGLEVTCHDCEGSVTIAPGYALDPCGEDIVIAQPTRFDIVAAIRACADQQRAKAGDCDPWAPPPDPGCRDAESHWCVALKYREIETSPVRGLIAGAVAAGCGCGSGAPAVSCGCGCSGAGSVITAPKVAMPALLGNNSCAPRRVLECYEIVAIPSKDGCAPKLLTRPARDNVAGVKPSPLGAWDQLIPKGTLLRAIIDCILKDIEELTAYLKTGDGQLIALVFTQSNAQLIASGVQLSSVHAAVCAFKAAIMAMLADDPHPTRCAMRRAAGEIMLPAPGPNTDPNAYLDLARDAVRDLIAVWFQLMIDCICHAFLPGCNDDPCDERVEIACVTVKAGKILSICNHSCRRYAGAFPSTFYWLSLVPVLPLIGKMLAALCCAPDLLRRNSPLVNDLMPILDKIDRTGALRSSFVYNNFAAPRALFANFLKAGEVPIAARVAKALDVAGTTTGHVGDDAEKARETLAAAGVRVEMVALSRDEEPEIVDAMNRQVPLLRRGESARLYTRDGKVVAAIREDAASGDPKAQAEELATLRGEVAELRKAVADLSRATRKR